MRNLMVLLCIAALSGQALATPVLEGSTLLSLPATGDTGTVTISLGGAETGLSGYNLTLSLSPIGAAEIVSVAYPSWARIPVNGTLPASSTYLQTVDLERHVEPGTSPIPLITVTLRAIADGETVLAVVPVIIEDDQGGRYALDPLQVMVQVGTAPSKTATLDAMLIASQPSPSSGDALFPRYPAATDTPAYSASPLPPETVESMTAATTASPVSLSTISALPAGEITTPSVKENPGFGCITAYLAGLVISLLTLIGRKPW